MENVEPMQIGVTQEAPGAVTPGQTIPETGTGPDSVEEYVMPAYPIGTITVHEVTLGNSAGFNADGDPLGTRW